MINASEADWFHIDIMDGVLFPIFLTESGLAAINKHEIDVHLMIASC
jgi:ribulose-phosphate 3-epimerase